SGISRYFCEIYRQLDLAGVPWEVACRFSNNAFLRSIRPIPEFFPNLEFRGKNRLLEALNRPATRSALRAGQFDVFHSTYSKPYRRELLGGKPYVITVHDMTHERFPELPSAHREAAEEADSIRWADGIITPSVATRDDLVALYPEAAQKIRVIYHGFRKPAHILPSPLAGRRYVLHVGTRKFYRDFPTAARAVGRIPGLALWCIGGGAFDEQEQQLFRSIGIENRVLQMGLDEPGLFGAYGDAEALIFPSLAEGFGLPIVEAQSMGCVPVLSDIPCFREIGGEGALYFAPGNVDACSAALAELMTHPRLKDQLREQASIGLTRFDWRASAQAHLSLYESLV
ncbi:MAG: glycosyltransferase family 1 protein, partial [Thiohalocapsa sp.]